MNLQIAKLIFLTFLSIMKKLLDLLEFKFGKESEEFKYLKSEIMNKIYEGLRKLFSTCETSNLIIKCPCKANLRKGYKDCEFCGGSGYKNK